MPKSITLLAFIFIFNLSQAQKKPLDHSVYDAWQSISNNVLSEDGAWIAYSVNPQQGDAKLVVTRTIGTAVQEMDRGKDPHFSLKSGHLVYLINAPFKDIRAAKIKKKKDADMPSDSLGIYSLENKTFFKVPRVKSFVLAHEDSPFLAYLQKVEKKTIDTLNKKNNKADDKTLFNLMLRDLNSSEEIAFENVNDYGFNENGQSLYFVKQSIDSISTEAGLYTYSLKDQVLKQVSSGKGEYKQITFNEQGDQLAFTAYKGPEKSDRKIFQLFHYNGKEDTARIIGSANDLFKDWAVSEHGKVQFSENGDKLFFGTAPIPPIKDTSLVDFETAKLDIWHWQDDYLQPQQLANLSRDLKKTYLTVINLNADHPKFISLSDPQLPYTQVAPTGNSAYILAYTDVGNRIATQWQTGAFQSLYIVSTNDGERTKIADGIRGPVSLSPNGKYVMWFDRSDAQWYTYSIETGQTVSLTKNLPVHFEREDQEVPDEANAYGIAGWAENDALVFIYDKYDVWSIEPNGKQARNITNGNGRAEQLTFRFIKLQTAGSRRSKPDPISLKEIQYMSVFDHRTKENGIAQILLKNGNRFKVLTKGPFTFKQIHTDKDQKTFTYTKENYQHSPNLYTSTDFNAELQLSHINSQQDNYIWGSAELIHWTTPQGHPAEGIVYKPEGFDENKTYPMIAYFYEILSNGLYQYIPPTPTPSRLNISYFVSNGYVVFAPDIHYQEGYPGRSSEEYVNSGVEYLKTKGYIDPSKIGIQGQSWGGYQVAHLITRTDAYAAAWAGAPVVNMTSAYGGIRWQSGMSRQFQYERTQSRIGKTLWEDLDLYIENSPLFHLPNVNTPIVIMANDADGAVPWYQGIEMFTALRRLQKPVWLLNYNGDAHNIVERKNKKDIQIREQQFFDHYLKGKPAPVWLKKGVPATLKGIDWGLELSN